MQFLYFIPGSLTSDDLSGVGLAHLGPASCLARSGSEIAGPDASPASCMRSSTRCASATLPNGRHGARHRVGKFWVGFDHDARPTPESLRLSDALLWCACEAARLATTGS